MYAHTRNYHRKDGPRARGEFVNVGFWVRRLPRLILGCRLLGHRPVVDGTEPLSPSDEGNRWVVCDRCGVRPDPQGRLPAATTIGRRYTGRWGPNKYKSAYWSDAEQRAEDLLSLKGKLYPPGGFPRRPEGEFGGQLVVGRNVASRIGWEVKVGNAGSEQALAASFHLGWIGSLYLHTEGFGRGVQRRLNPTGYQSRVTGFHISAREIAWRLWSLRDGPNAGREPRWQRGSIDIRIVDKVLGPKLYHYTDVAGGETARLLRLSDGEYLIGLKLKRCVHGRAHGRKRSSWSVEWRALGRGIPTRSPGRGRIFGSGVTVSDGAVRAGTWPAAAIAAIAARIADMRTQHDWEPDGRVPIPVEVAA